MHKDECEYIVTNKEAKKQRETTASLALASLQTFILLQYIHIL